MVCGKTGILIITNLQKGKNDRAAPDWEVFDTAADFSNCPERLTLNNGQISSHTFFLLFHISC